MVRALLRRKSTGEVLKRAHYPRVDLKPVVNLDADLEWVLYEQKQDGPFDPYTETVEESQNTISAGIVDNPELQKVVMERIVIKKPLVEAKLSLKELVEEVATFNANVYSQLAIKAVIAGTPKATVLSALGDKFNTMFTAIVNLRADVDGMTVEEIELIKQKVENARENA